MPCDLLKFTREKATHYIGKSGKEYPVELWYNWGRGIAENKFGSGWKDDLPKDDYPYTKKYAVEQVFNCCNHCDCPEKLNNLK